MSDFISQWVSILDDLFGMHSFSVYYEGSPVWSMDYGTFTGYVLWLLLVLWLVVLSVRMFRKLLVGVIG